MPEMPIEFLSPSGAKTFDTCPSRWRSRYIERVPDPPGEASLVGTVAHDILQHLLARPPTERTMDTAKAIAGERWAVLSATEDIERLRLDSAGVRRFKQAVWNGVADAFREQLDKIDVHSVEAELVATVGGVPFRGYADRIDRLDGDKLRIVDYKTGRAWPDHADQVRLYIAAARASGLRATSARLVYIGRTRRIVDVEATPAQLGRTMHHHADTWLRIRRAVETDTFPATPSALCRFCPIRDRCSVAR